MKNILQFVPIVTLIIGMSCQAVSLPCWISSFGENLSGPYFILCWASLMFTLFYGLLFLFVNLFKKTKHISFKIWVKSYIIQGFVNCLNGIFVVYGSPITRTPPILFLCIGNIGIFFSIVLTRYIIKEKSYMSYLNWKPICALSAIIVSIILMIVGKIIHDVETTKYDSIIILWIVIVIIGVFCGTLYNVLQERYFTKLTKYYGENYEKDGYFSNILFWTTVFQLIFMVMFFEVDIIPKFGYSTPDNFLENFKNSMYCFFGYGCNYNSLMWGTIFVFGYITTYISNTLINKDSANFANYATAIQTPLSAIVFIIMGFGTESTPLWAVIPSLIILTCSIVIWKTWENKVKADFENEICYIFTSENKV